MSAQAYGTAPGRRSAVASTAPTRPSRRPKPLIAGAAKVSMKALGIPKQKGR